MLNPSIECYLVRILFVRARTRRFASRFGFKSSVAPQSRGTSKVPGWAAGLPAPGVVSGSIVPAGRCGDWRGSRSLKRQ